jgi:hypothetical protein
MSKGQKIKIGIPSGSWWAYAWITGKNKQITVDVGFFIGPSKTDDLLRLVIKPESMSWVGP